MVVIEGTIKGKGRPRLGKHGTHTPEDTLNYENWVKYCYRQQERKFLEGPIKAEITAYFLVPKSYTKKKIEAIRQGIEFPCKKPDIDNITKIILDSLNNTAYKDDSQIVQLIVNKKWTFENERVELELIQI